MVLAVKLCYKLVTGWYEHATNAISSQIRLPTLGRRRSSVVQEVPREVREEVCHWSYTPAGDEKWSKYIS